MSRRSQNKVIGKEGQSIEFSVTLDGQVRLTNDSDPERGTTREFFGGEGGRNREQEEGLRASQSV